MRIKLLSLLLLLPAPFCAAQIAYVPLQFRTIEGIRPFVPVQLNGKPFLFMVHANAGFYIQTTHAHAAFAGVTGSTPPEPFGIDKPGHVSALGMTRATLQTLTVGPVTDTDVPLQIFEVPIPDMDGMLGIPWLRANGIIVDYNSQRLGFARTLAQAQAEDRRLIHEGFVAHPITWDEKEQRYFITCLIEGKPARMIVSTVSTNILDLAFAQRAAIPLGPVVYLDAGPAGAQVPNYLSKHPVTITIEGQRTAATQPIIQNIYAYSTKPRPTDPGLEINGYLGCDFMLANEAVIDFESGTLLLKQEK